VSAALKLYKPDETDYDRHMAEMRENQIAGERKMDPRETIVIGFDNGVEDRKCPTYHFDELTESCKEGYAIGEGLRKQLIKRGVPLAVINRGMLNRVFRLYTKLEKENETQLVGVMDGLMGAESKLKGRAFGEKIRKVLVEFGVPEAMVVPVVVAVCVHFYIVYSWCDIWEPEPNSPLECAADNKRA